MLGTEYRWRDSRLWRDSLIYPGINTVLVLGAASVVGILYLVSREFTAMWILAGLIIAVLVILPVLFGVPGVLFLLKKHWYSLDVSRSRAVATFVVVILVTNFAYLALAFGYAALIGVV
jgi:hypothetical protein